MNELNAAKIAAHLILSLSRTCTKGKHSMFTFASVGHERRKETTRVTPKQFNSSQLPFHIGVEVCTFYASSSPYKSTHQSDMKSEREGERDFR